MKSRKFDFVIIGAGLSGLGAGITLSKHLPEKDIAVFEKNSTPGGLFGSFRLKNCCFDFGPKILLLNKSKYKNELLSYLKNNYEKYPVRESTYLSGFGLLGFPLQRFLVDLPQSEQNKIINNLNFNQTENKKINNYQDWLINNFGEYFCKKILFPYELKKWQTKLNKLDYKWALKRPIKVNKKELLTGAKKRLPTNKYYYYPKKGSMSLLTKNMAKDVRQIFYNSKVTEINCMEKFVVINNHKKIRFDYLINTMPINELAVNTVKLSPEVKNSAAAKLKWLDVKVFNFAFEKKRELPGTAVYFPEEKFIFRRLSILQNLCPGLQGNKYSLISAEVSINDNNSKIITENEILKNIKKVPQYKGLGKPLFSKSIIIKNAYPVPLKNSFRVVDKIKGILGRKQIYSCGRGGNFKYCNGDEAYAQGVELAQKLIK